MWRIFAVGEGLMKTLGSIFQKMVGKVMGTLEMGCIATVIIGTIQMTSGFVGFLKQCKDDPKKVALLVPDIRSVSWALLFGFFASLPMTVLSIYVFTLGADMGVKALLIVCSIVPGAIAGKIIWGDELGGWQILGILAFLTAVWAMLDFPTLSMVLELPLWVWLTFVITFSQVINEILIRAASVKLNIWTNNFWVGASTVFCALTALLLLGGFSGGVVLDMTGTFMFGSVIIGAIVVVMISFKLLSYAGGGTIALKKLIMQGSYLMTVTFAGILVYNEPFTTGKMVGLLIYPVAFVLTDNGTRKFVFQIIKSDGNKSVSCP